MAKVSRRGGREQKVRRCIWKGWPLVSESMKEWRLRIERRGEERGERRRGRYRDRAGRDQCRGINLEKDLREGTGWQDGE